VAVVAGTGFGFAVGKPVQPEDIVPARSMPADLCARIGDVSALLPKASTQGPVIMVQGGKTSVSCEAGTTRGKVAAYAAGAVTVTITAYGGMDAGAGNSPFTPEQVAKKTFTRSPMSAVADRPYPTKARRTPKGDAGESWTVQTVVQRADLVVQVDYTANPVNADTAQQAALALADRAIWEAK
jgi:hypothetical protein